MRTPPSPTAQGDTLRRGLLPEVLTPDDVAVALRLPNAAAARRLLRTGRLCPYARVGQRFYVRRDALLRALAERESSADGPRGLAIVAGEAAAPVRPTAPGGPS